MSFSQFPCTPLLRTVFSWGPGNGQGFDSPRLMPTLLPAWLLRDALSPSPLCFPLCFPLCSPLCSSLCFPLCSPLCSFLRPFLFFSRSPLLLFSFTPPRFFPGKRKGPAAKPQALSLFFPFYLNPCVQGDQPSVMLPTMAASISSSIWGFSRLRI